MSTDDMRPQSDTPRTDAVAKKLGSLVGNYALRIIAGERGTLFACADEMSEALEDSRTLERELAVVRAELAKWKDRVTDIRTATEATVEGLRAELADARERIAALEEKQ